MCSLNHAIPQILIPVRLIAMGHFNVLPNNRTVIPQIWNSTDFDAAARPPIQSRGMRFPAKQSPSQTIMWHRTKLSSMLTWWKLKKLSAALHWWAPFTEKCLCNNESVRQQITHHFTILSVVKMFTTIYDGSETICLLRLEAGKQLHSKGLFHNIEPFHGHFWQAAAYIVA